MIELMEPATYASGSRNLRNPQNWLEGHGIIPFLENTKSAKIKVLKQDDFIPSKSTSTCLVPLVFMALFVARREGSILF